MFYSIKQKINKEQHDSNSNVDLYKVVYHIITMVLSYYFLSVINSICALI